MGYLRCFKQNFINAISEPTIEGVTPSFTIKVRGPLNDDIMLDFDKETRRFLVSGMAKKKRGAIGHIEGTHIVLTYFLLYPVDLSPTIASLASPSRS